MFTSCSKARAVAWGLSIVLLSACFAPLLALGQVSSISSDGLTPVDAVEIALRRNPLTRVTNAGRQLADAEASEARSRRLPQVITTGSFTRSNNPVFVFGSLLEQGRFGPTNFAIDSLNRPDAVNNFRSSLTLRLPVFDQRETETRIASARFQQQQAEQQTNLVEQQIRFEVIKTYYGLLLIQAKLNVAEDAVRTAEADVKRARDLVETGVAVQSDLLAARVQLSQFRQQEIQMAGESATALAALNVALGLPIDTPQQLLAKLVDRRFTVDPLEVLLSQALQNRPDYQRAVLSSRATMAKLHGARGEWLPRVDAFITAGRSTEHFTGGSGDYAAGATVSFNLFDAGRKSRIAQATATQSIANAEQERLANQIRFEVVRAYQQYVSARERLTVVVEVSAQASETLRIVQDRYRAGITTITELLHAETALVQARSDLLAARYEQYLSYANILLATGQLKDVRVFGS
ncbi:MAG TPA: TolC family protein [Pyrinomonadaceae bacterium]|nr:TolC family protein [Pyrinomonadaceae bacterium]